MEKSQKEQMAFEKQRLWLSRALELPRDHKAMIMALEERIFSECEDTIQSWLEIGEPRYAEGTLFGLAPRRPKVKGNERWTQPLGMPPCRYGLRYTPQRRLFFNRHCKDDFPGWEAGSLGPRKKKLRRPKAAPGGRTSDSHSTLSNSNTDGRKKGSRLINLDNLLYMDSIW